jgi:hypothetical protein
MGLTLHIYKPGYGDCSNGGISGRCDEVVCVNIDGPSEPDENRPPVLLVGGAIPGIARCVPAAEHLGIWGQAWPDGVGPMMGGCYVSTSDSRFSEKVEEIVGGRFYGAVALHDRYETAKQYASHD